MKNAVKFRTIFAVTCATLALSAMAQTADSVASDGTATPSQDVMSPKAVRAANGKLKRGVSTALARTKGLDSSRILVKADSGIVTLSGTVADASQISLAASVAQRVSGVKSVKNLLRVDTRAFSSS